MDEAPMQAESITSQDAGASEDNGKRPPTKELRKVTVTSDGIQGDEEISRTALVIEDSRLIRHTLCVLLKNRGFTTVEAEDGQDALDKLAEQGHETIDLIFTDIMMPNLDGLGFLRAARQKYGQTLPPVIACSAVADKRVIKEMAPLGLAGYIIKPFKSAVVFKKLEALFPDTVPER